jgi:hypothetical protein
MTEYDENDDEEQRTDGEAPLWARDLAKVRSGEGMDTVGVEITIEVASDSAAALQSAFDVGAPIEVDVSTNGFGIASGAVLSLEPAGEVTYEAGYDKRGNKIPLPSDTCDACGVRREDRPDGFAPEIVTPFGEVEYLCGRCREAGRGMK